MPASGFPQMKRQPAVQAFEEVEHRGQLQGFTPPEGRFRSVGLERFRTSINAWRSPEQDAIFPNPCRRPAIAQTGEKLYFSATASTCHGPDGPRRWSRWPPSPFRAARDGARSRWSAPSPGP